jgi:cell division protein FtsB
MNTLFYVVCIVAIVFTADTIQKYLKMKNQEKPSDPELEETLAHIEQLEERIRVLERIVTEKRTDLRSEIDRLR